MKCPKCEVRLEQIYMHEIPIEKCPQCDGVWLDKGEMELIAEHERSEQGWLSKMLKSWAQK
jgi:Zn-finger nucleic acid-binding protein